MAVASHLVRPTRSSSDSGTSLAAYLALLRLGVTLPRPLPAARWALTPPFHPCPWIRAVCFLWPFPSPHGAQVLPGSQPYGARTFLGIARPGSDPRPSRPTNSPSLEKVPISSAPRQGGRCQLLISQALSVVRAATYCRFRANCRTGGRRARTRRSPGRPGASSPPRPLA